MHKDFAFSHLLCLGSSGSMIRLSFLAVSATPSHAGHGTVWRNGHLRSGEEGFAMKIPANRLP